MINKNKISVVLPTYNVEKYISRCLNSLQKQTLKDFEIVVVDDCGNDNSINIAEEYAKNDNRIKIIYNPKNMGTYHARRVGVENSSGEYIVFLDPDDELEKDLLEQVYEKFLISNAEILFYGIKYIPKLKWYNKKPYLYPKENEKFLLSAFFSNTRNNYETKTAGKAFSKNFLYKLYNELNIDKDMRFIFAEDTYLSINAMLYKPKYTILKYDGYIYHINSTSITIQDSKKMNENIKQYDFMMNEIDKNVQNTVLSFEENKAYKILKKKFFADRYLALRNSGTKKDYFTRVLKSFFIVPSFSKLVRLTIFIISFGTKRV